MGAGAPMAFVMIIFLYMSWPVNVSEILTLWQLNPMVCLILRKMTGDHAVYEGEMP